MRLNLIKKFLKHPILVKKSENLFYLTGRSLENKAEEFLLLLPPPQPSPHRMHSGGGSRAQAVAFGYGLEKMDWFKKTDRLKNIGKYLKGYKNLDIEYGFTYAEGEYLKQKLQVASNKLQVKPARSVVDVIRQVKTSGEIALIRKSMQIVERVFGLVRKEIKKPAMTEIKLAEFIRKNGFNLGAQDVSFPPIVACGANAAIPHHVPSSKKLKAGESIILDFGFKYKNYCSDFTRTVFLKKVPKKLEIAYNQVEKAYNECISSLRVQPKQSYLFKRLPRPSDALRARNDKPLTGNDLYQKAVDVLAENKLDKYFIHSLGHGTGLEIHELPNLSPKSKDFMQNGMVFSIEPGVYIEGLGGIRIEDLVYLDKGKCKKFINVSTKLKENIW